jgi:hypothetical protein
LPAPTPPPSGFPSASTTGVPVGKTLTPSGPLNITAAGTVIDGVVAPHVIVNAPNVTIRNSRISSSAVWLVDNNSTGLVVEDSEIVGQGSCHVGLGSNNFTVRRTEFTACENGMDIGTTGNVIVEDNWIHDLYTGGGAHTDGIQIGQGAHDLIIRRNHISPQDSGAPSSTAAIIMWTQANPQNTRVRIENNLLDGSHASVALYAPRMPASNIYINGNRFRRGVYGYADSVRVPSTVTEFNGNVDDVTGAPVRAGG